MESFIDNVKNWIIREVDNVMTGLVVPVGAIALLAIAVVTFITGIMKMHSQKDDFKKYLIACIVCVAGAIILGSIWIWGRAAAGV